MTTPTPPIYRLDGSVSRNGQLIDIPCLATRGPEERADRTAFLRITPSQAQALAADLTANTKEIDSEYEPKPSPLVVALREASASFHAHGTVRSDPNFMELFRVFSLLANHFESQENKTSQE